jgi:hypothetical protein
VARAVVAGGLVVRLLMIGWMVVVGAQTEVLREDREQTGENEDEVSDHAVLPKP